MVKKLTKLIAIAAASLLLVACASKSGKGAGADDAASASGAGGHGSHAGQMSDQELMKRVVFYFDFDKSDVKDEYVDSIRAHARYLVANPNAKVRVEGHTDERGSREYNIGLGEHRAKAVANMLMLDGAKKHQIAIVSFGSEKPAVQGHNEEAWQYNRRAIVVYEAN